MSTTTATKRRLEELLAPLDVLLSTPLNPQPQQLECDGFLFAAVWLLHREGIEHTCHGGRVSYTTPRPVPAMEELISQGTPWPVARTRRTTTKEIPLHYWITVGDLLIDYRLRRWFGPAAPHGVHEGRPPGVLYDGREITMTPNPALYELLTGYPYDGKTGGPVLAGKI